MTGLFDIIDSIATEFGKATGINNHHLGHLPENFKAPCFAYYLVYNNETHNSYNLKKIDLDIQIIYINSKKCYDNNNFKANIQVMDKLKVFLSQFNLNVKDRNLKFKYDIRETDGQLFVDMKFKFIDDNTVNINEPVYDNMENIEIKK